jgi:hypothetical protein
LEYLFLTFPIILLLWLIYKYPQQMKNLFAFKKKPVEPVAHVYETVPPVPGTAISRADALAYENISDINEPIQQAVAVVPKHEIIRHDYYKSVTTGNMWPQWTCRSGASDMLPTSSYEPLETTQRKVRLRGQKHVADAIQADENLRKSNGKFAF